MFIDSGELTSHQLLCLDLEWRRSEEVVKHTNYTGREREREKNDGSQAGNAYVYPSAIIGNCK